MEQQDKLNEKTTKWFKLEKTPPEKFKKIARVVGIIYGALNLLTALNVWEQGNYGDAKSRAIRGMMVIIATIIITSPKIHLYEKYAEFMQKIATIFKRKDDKNID